MPDLIYKFEELPVGEYEVEGELTVQYRRDNSWDPCLPVRILRVFKDGDAMADFFPILASVTSMAVLRLRWDQIGSAVRDANSERDPPEVERAQEAADRCE